jgi:hypothetical protein
MDLWVSQHLKRRGGLHAFEESNFCPDSEHGWCFVSRQKTRQHMVTFKHVGALTLTKPTKSLPPHPLPVIFSEM